MEESSQATLIGKRHQWTRDEDAKLVDCLLELAACKKWTGDNGTFKSGYAKQLEQWLHQKMPGCGLKASPHIESRVKHLKKQYGAIADMLKASGFGWNDQDKMIVVEKNVFDDWVKSHPKAQGLYKKPFPHFDDLALVYGKDRATGIDAEDPGDAFEAIDKETEDVSFMGDDANMDEAPVDSVPETQLPQSPCHYSTHTGNGVSNGQNSASSARGKRKRTGGTNSVVEQLVETMQSLGKVYEITKDNIGDLVGCFKHEKGAERRMQVFEELKMIEGLTNMERVRVGSMITKDQNAVDYFFTIDPEFKVFYVQQVLAANTL